MWIWENWGFENIIFKEIENFYNVIFEKIEILIIEKLKMGIWICQFWKKKYDLKNVNLDEDFENVNFDAHTKLPRHTKASQGKPRHAKAPKKSQIQTKARQGRPRHAKAP